MVVVVVVVVVMVVVVVVVVKEAWYRDSTTTFKMKATAHFSADAVVLLRWQAPSLAFAVMTDSPVFHEVKIS